MRSIIPLVLSIFCCGLPGTSLAQAQYDESRSCLSTQDARNALFDDSIPGLPPNANFNRWQHWPLAAQTGSSARRWFLAHSVVGTMRCGG